MKWNVHLFLVVILVAANACGPPAPPIVIRPPQVIMLPPKGHRQPPEVLTYATLEQCPMPLRLRVRNETLSHIFEFWIDPEAWDKGLPAGPAWQVFPVTLAAYGLREIIFCLSPGSHDVWYRSFWYAGRYGSPPGPAGDLTVRLWNLEQPGPYGRQILFEIRGGRDP